MKQHLKLKSFRTLAAVILVNLVIREIPLAYAGENTNAAAASCCVKELKAGPAVSDTSLYQLDSTWTTDAGKEIKLGSLAGRPQVVTMFFANCVVACPILAHNMRNIEAALPDQVRTNVGFVLISFDTERDTPQALAKFRRARNIPDHWTLLTAKPDDILELAALLGVKFKKEASEQFAHSNLITILNAKGEILLQQDGLNRDPAEAVVALKNLSSAKPPK